MGPESLLAVEIGCWALAACFGLGGLALQVRDGFQTDEQRRATRQWYGSKWETIQRTGLLKLPQIVIVWLLRAKWRVAQVTGSLGSTVIESRAWWLVALCSTAAASTLGTWMVFGRWWVAVTAGLASIAIGPVLWVEEKTDRVSPDWAANPLLLLSALAWLVGLICLLKVFLTFSTALAALAMAVLLPLFAVGLSLGVVAGAYAADEIGLKVVPGGETVGVLGIAVALSFFVTLCALLVGHAVKADAAVPQTLQMLFSNVVCDGLTMLATVLILGAAVGPQRKFPIPAAILLDLALAVVLACASLWCGLVRTENALSVTQVARVLIAQSPSGTRFQFGPYFWAMHTTFLPTLLYLSLIALCWLAKLVVLPLSLVLEKGGVVEKPHQASALTLLLVGFVFAALGKGLPYLRSYATLPDS